MRDCCLEWKGVESHLLDMPKKRSCKQPSTTGVTADTRYIHRICRKVGARLRRQSTEWQCKVLVFVRKVGERLRCHHSPRRRVNRWIYLSWCQKPWEMDWEMLATVGWRDEIWMIDSRCRLGRKWNSILSKFNVGTISVTMMIVTLSRCYIISNT